MFFFETKNEKFTNAHQFTHFSKESFIEMSVEQKSGTVTEKTSFLPWKSEYSFFGTQLPRNSRSWDLKNHVCIINSALSLKLYAEFVVIPTAQFCALFESESKFTKPEDIVEWFTKTAWEEEHSSTAIPYSLSPTQSSNKIWKTLDRSQYCFRTMHSESFMNADFVIHGHFMSL